MTFSLKRAQRIASAYDAMPHEPERPDVREAYQAFKDEVYEQFQSLPVRVLFTSDNPYETSRAMMADVEDHKCLRVYQGGELPADHPLAEVAGTGMGIGFSVGITYNDLFRAVHDYYGHYIPRVGFGPKGEDAAWWNHSRMFSPLACKAMTTETRGQNSWFNAHNKPGVEPKVYAPQKAGILPDFAFEV